jgi:hypothetical protein
MTKFHYDAERGLLTLEASEEDAQLVLKAQAIIEEIEARGETWREPRCFGEPR